MKKIGQMNELAWIFGNLLCALGVALSTKAGLGLSMIAAPPFIFNQYLIRFSAFFTQGTVEYIVQALLLIIMCLIIGKFKIKHLFSFLTAFIFGNMVDLMLFLLGGQAVYSTMTVRISMFVLSQVINAFAIAFYFRTDLPLCIYELFVKAVAERFNIPTDKMKFIYDASMLLLSLVSSFILFGRLVGIGVGTIVITAFNALAISTAGKLLDKIFTFEPRFEGFVKKIS